MDERQHSYVEPALAERRDQQRPLPLGTRDFEPGTDKEDCSSASDGHAASVALTASLGRNRAFLYLGTVQAYVDASCSRTRLSSSGPYRSG